MFSSITQSSGVVALGKVRDCPMVAMSTKRSAIAANHNNLADELQNRCRVGNPACSECITTAAEKHTSRLGIARPVVSSTPRGGGVERQRHGRCRGETPLLSLVGGMTYMPCVKSIPPRGEVNLEGGE